MTIRLLSACPGAWRHSLPAMLALVAVLFFGSCSEDSEPYPNLLTEMADVHTDHSGRLYRFVLDNGMGYTITNTNIQPHRPDTVYRAVVGYVPEPTTSSSSLPAQIYALTGARVLADSTAVVRHDPAGIESMWSAGSYINMQLTAKSQGGIHYWGYAVDSRDMAGVEGRLHSHHHLSIHHVQGNDPLSYSSTYYCSISVPAIPYYLSGDTVTVTVHTFNGDKAWTFCPSTTSHISSL